MIILGDCLEKLASLGDKSIDAVVTDPPYGWRFMGKAWDGADIEKFAKSKERGGVMADGKIRKPRDLPAESAGTYDTTINGNLAFQYFSMEWAREAFRVLKPGGHMLAFCGPRTYHRMASGVEDAGFEIRDQLQWLFGSGFPKSHNLDGEWEGWGTALKPANEPIVLARKPLSEKTVALNMLKWGVGALNIDGSRIGTSDNLNGGAYSPGDRKRNESAFGGGVGGGVMSGANGEYIQPQGRWPANVIFGCACEDAEHDQMCAVHLLDEQSGTLKSGDLKKDQYKDGKKNQIYGQYGGFEMPARSGDSGGASRFFYCAKASKSERNKGLENEIKQKEGARPNSQDSTGKFPDHDHRPSGGNNHPTVKPIKLMEYLTRLICPVGGVVLDPFMGSGTTGVAAKNLGFNFIGIEMNKEYCEIAKKRLDFTKSQLELTT